MRSDAPGLASFTPACPHPEGDERNRSHRSAQLQRDLVEQSPRRARSDPRRRPHPDRLDGDPGRGRTDGRSVAPRSRDRADAGCRRDGPDWISGRGPSGLGARQEPPEQPRRGRCPGRRLQGRPGAESRGQQGGPLPGGQRVRERDRGRGNRGRAGGAHRRPCPRLPGRAPRRARYGAPELEHHPTGSSP
jgi:hypothetical protein